MITENSRPNLIEAYFSSAREELMWRIKHRDAWLGLHLLTQAAIFAIADGIKIFAAGDTQPHPDIIIFAFPAALLFTCFYTVEDRLAGYLSHYIGQISIADRTLWGYPVIMNWDNSLHLQRYASDGTLHVRFAAQLVSFLVVPTIIICHELSKNSVLIDGIQLLQILGFFALTILALMWSYILRKRTGRASNLSILGDA